MPSADKLMEFVAWVQAHLTGDEKGEAQIFLDRLFQAFGHAGLKEAGATLEMRVSKAAEAGGGTAFADLVWKPVVLVEMKKRGANLQKSSCQTFDYWTLVTGERPRYVVRCNLDEFWIYSFDSNLDAPKDKLALADLPTAGGPLACLAPGSPFVCSGSAVKLWSSRSIRSARDKAGKRQEPSARVKCEAPFTARTNRAFATVGCSQRTPGCPSRLARGRSG